MYSANARTFQTARRELAGIARIFKDPHMSKHFAHNGVTLKFIAPPAALVRRVMGVKGRHGQEMPEDSSGKSTSRKGISENSFGGDSSCHKLQATHLRWLQHAYSKLLSEWRMSDDIAYRC